MCLACKREVGAHGKEQIEKLFTFPTWAKRTTQKGFGMSGNYLHTHDNKEIELNWAQLGEIINNALVVIATGVDTRVDIWAIQWKNDYKVKNL